MPLMMLFIVLYSIAFFTTLHMSEDLVIERYLRRIAAEFGKQEGAYTLTEKQKFWGVDVFSDRKQLPDFIHAAYPESREGFFEFNQQGNEQVMLVLRQGKEWRYFVENIWDLEIGEADERRIILYFVLASTLVFLLSLYLIHRTAHRLSHPLAQITQKIERSDGVLPMELEILAGSPAELGKLIGALRGMQRRVKQHIHRERQFTGFVSHELRTPLSIIKSANSLLASQVTEPKLQTHHATLERAVTDMEALIDTFLMLGREHGTRQFRGRQLDEAWLKSATQRFQHLMKHRTLQLDIQVVGTVEVEAPITVLDVLLNNIVKNAITYSDDGIIALSLGNGSLSVQNPLPMRKTSMVDDADVLEMRQHGLGLLIVKEICTRFGWQLELQEGPQEMRVRVQFVPR